MIRNYEGTTRLQGIGVCQGIKAKNLKVGDVLVWNFGGTSIVKEITFSKTGKTLTIIEECNGTDYERRMTAERIVVVKELNPAPAVEEVEVEEVEVEEVEVEEVEVEEVEVVESEALDVTGVNYYNMEELKDMVANWSELSQYIKIFIESASKFDFDGNELIIYMGRKAVASGMFYVKGGKIVITSIGAGELFQWEKGKAEEKEAQEVEEVETVKTVSVEGVEEEKALINKSIIADAIKKEGFVVGCYDSRIEQLKKSQLKRIIEQALVLEWTDVVIIVNGVKCVVEISTVDNEKDFNLMTYKEYKNTYQN